MSAGSHFVTDVCILNSHVPRASKAVRSPLTRVRPYHQARNRQARSGYQTCPRPWVPWKGSQGAIYGVLPWTSDVAQGPWVLYAWSDCRVNAGHCQGRTAGQNVRQAHDHIVCAEIITIKSGSIPTTFGTGTGLIVYLSGQLCSITF